MPTYEVTLNGRTFEVDAPTPRAARINAQRVIVREAGEKERAQKEGVVRSWVSAGPTRVKTGLRRMFGSESSLDERAGGLADVAKGAGITALPMIGGPLIQAAIKAPAAAIGMVAGGMAGAPVARQLAESAGAGQGVTELTEVVGGGVGSAGGGAVMRPIGRATSRAAQGAGEQLYRWAGFKETPIDVNAQMRAAAAGAPAPVSTAIGAMQRGMTGDAVDIGARAMRRLDVVHPRLLASAGRRQVPRLQNRDAIADTLDMVAADLRSSPYAGRDVAPEAARLAQALRSSDAPMAIDVLKAKILLDKARISSSYKLDPNLSARQGDLVRASDDLRGAFHRADPNLSALLADERASMRIMESMIAKAVKDGNRELVQFLDPLTATAGAVVAGPAGLAAPLLRRGVQSTRLLTGAGQSLFKMGGGQTVGIPEAAAMPRAAGQLTSGARQMPPSPDPSFARGVPAQVSISGRPRQLTAGRPVRVTPQPGQGASSVSSVPAAPLEYRIDPTTRARQGVTVQQYSGDPAASPVALVPPPVKSVLERMKSDLETFMPQRGRLVRESLDTSDTHYAQGGAGSPVGDDIRVISEQNVSNRDILAAVDDLLAGKAPSNRLHTAALDAARGYLERRPGYRGPAMGMSDLDDPDFAAWSKALDDIIGGD